MEKKVIVPRRLTKAGKLICCINMTHGWIYRELLHIHPNGFFCRDKSLSFNGLQRVWDLEFNPKMWSGCWPSTSAALHRLTPQYVQNWNVWHFPYIVSLWHNVTFRWNLTAISPCQLIMSHNTFMSLTNLLFSSRLTFMLTKNCSTFKECKKICATKAQIKLWNLSTFNWSTYPSTSATLSISQLQLSKKKFIYLISMNHIHNLCSGYRN